MRFTLDSPHAVLTNRLVPAPSGDNVDGRQLPEKHSLFGRAKVQLNAKLGQLYKTAMYEETKEELEEYANFMTQVCVRPRNTLKFKFKNYF